MLQQAGLNDLCALKGLLGVFAKLWKEPLHFVYKCLPARVELGSHGTHFRDILYQWLLVKYSIMKKVQVLLKYRTL